MIEERDEICSPTRETSCASCEKRRIVRSRLMTSARSADAICVDSVVCAISGVETARSPLVMRLRSSTVVRRRDRTVRSHHWTATRQMPEETSAASMTRQKSAQFMAGISHRKSANSA